MADLLFNKQITDKCECFGLTLRQKQTRYDLSCFVSFFEADQKLNKLEIEHKSLILAQIERWRHALHMQVERQHGCLHLMASGERVSNASERTE